MFRGIFRLIKILIILTVVVASSEYTQKYIIIKSNQIDNAKSIEKQILKNTSFDKIGLDLNKLIKVSKDNSGLTVTIGPLADDEKFALIYFELKQIFKNVTTKSLHSQKLPKVDYSIDNPNSSSDDNLDLWIAIFILAFMGIFALFFSSLQIRRIITQNERMRRRQEAIERKQHELFSKMGEDIYSMSKDVIDRTKDMMSNFDEVPHELQEVVNTENKILDTTNHLLEFLKIKAKKVKVKNKKFKINNMLDDVVGYFVGKYPNSDLELVLDINHNVPKYIIGSFTNIVTIIQNLVEHQLNIMERGEVVVSISINKDYEKGVKLHIQISQYGLLHIKDADNENYFLPDSITNEEHNPYDRLGVFVSYELTHLLNGDIEVKDLEEGGKQIDILIPIEMVKGDVKSYKLPKKLHNKSVYIVNRYPHASLAQKELFTYFKYKVHIDSKDNFVKNKPNLSEYNIVLIDEMLIYKNFETYAKFLREKYNTKLVMLSNILDRDTINPDSFYFDKVAKKPLTQEHVFLLIKSLYIDEIILDGNSKDSDDLSNKFIANIQELPYIRVEDLSKFANSRILIVEDNEINQKMLSAILNRVGIFTDIASNGKEAIELLETNGMNYYDLVLMDINMPVMDGFTAVKKIREMEGSETLPIVSLTALVLEQEIEKMKDYGMNAFLPKPINIGKLYNVFKIFIKTDKKDTKKNTKLSSKKSYKLNIEVGLSYSNQNTLLYKEILKEFMEVYGNSDRVMKTLYEQKNLESIKNISFDIMGLAKTIGAEKLYQSANEIYKLFLYNKTELLPKFIDVYAKEIKDVRKEIKDFLAS